MSQFYPPDTGTQPTPVVQPPYVPQTPIPPAQPPRKSIPNRTKFAVAFLATLIFIAVFLVIGIVANAGGATPTVDTSATATAQAQNDNATAAALETADAASNIQLSNDLTQQAMTPTPVPTTPVDTTGVGSTQSSGLWSITINSIKPTVSGNQFEVPKPGNQFILINFTALNTDSAAHDMNPFYFTLRDDSGTSYDIAIVDTAHSADGTVVGGQKLRGDLPYEIPKTLHNLTLQFDSPDDFSHSQVVQWNLSI